jgi:hypothetical protein
MPWRPLFVIVTLLCLATSLPLQAQPIVDFAGGGWLRALTPSTLLPAGTTSVEIILETEETATCHYALGASPPIDAMTPFVSTDSNQHTTVIDGLNPDRTIINEVFIRCAPRPDDLLHLRYRVLSTFNPSFPRLGNLDGSWQYRADGISQDDAEIDLWLNAEFTPSQATELRNMNPDVQILAGWNAVEATEVDNVPDDYFLLDTEGNRVEVWPGAWRLNMTRLEIAEYWALRAYAQFDDDDWMYDGIFLDNVYLSQSWQTEDIYDAPFAYDSDQDGQKDDEGTFDVAWRAGVLHFLRVLRGLLPHALFMGHWMEAQDPEMQAIFNGAGVTFDIPEVIEGRQTFGELWAKYTAWQTLPMQPRLTLIESAIPLEIAYGYGYSPLEGFVPESTLEFVRTYYPYMRFGLATTLMQDGYFTHEFGDAYHGNRWRYDELDHNLGYPLAPAEQVLLPITVDTTDRIINGGFESVVEGTWNFWDGDEVDDGYAAELTREIGAGADGSTAARVQVTEAQGASWIIQMAQFDLEITEGTIYELRFWARSDTLRNMNVTVQKSAPEWDNYGMNQMVGVTEEWQQFTLYWRANRSTDEARLLFHFGNQTGNTWIDNIEMIESVPYYMQREFDNGMVLVNPNTAPVTIPVPAGFQRLQGDQAPRYQYIVDDTDSGFSASSEWFETSYSTEEWLALPPFYHDWGTSVRQSLSGEARWELTIPIEDTYTVSAWFPAAPEAMAWNGAVVYEIVQSDQVVATATIDQRVNGDRWHIIGEAALAPGAFVRLRCDGSAPCVADAIYVQSRTRFNDGTPVSEVTLAGMDGIVLARSE